MSLLHCSVAHDSLRTPGCNPQLARLPCDAWHHHYHYQASAQYLWLGEALLATGRHQEAKAAFTRAVFQDHSNAEAISAQAGNAIRPPHAPRYAAHPGSDAAFCASIGRPVTHASRLHDAAMEALARQGFDAALGLLDRAIASDSTHSGSHFARGKCFFLRYLEEPDPTLLVQACAALEEAVRLSQLDHDGYHRQASADHTARAAAFLQQGQGDLAVADCSRALDLFAANNDARRLRAAAYRAKGNLALAQADEANCRYYAGNQ